IHGTKFTQKVWNVPRHYLREYFALAVIQVQRGNTRGELGAGKSVYGTSGQLKNLSVSGEKEAPGSKHQAPQKPKSASPPERGFSSPPQTARGNMRALRLRWPKTPVGGGLFIDSEALE